MEEDGNGEDWKGEDWNGEEGRAKERKGFQTNIAERRTIKKWKRNIR